MTLLAASLDNLGLLMLFRNLLNSIDSSILTVVIPCSDFFQSSSHFFLSLVLCIVFSTVGLISRGFLRYEGRSFLSELHLLAASLASLSTNSFLSSPSCPAVQCLISGCVLFFLFFFI